MQTKHILIKQKNINIVVLALVAFCAITIFSQNSFLYNFNDCPDISYMLNVGKQVLNGRTLYVDSFDQKGPYCVAIYVFANIFGSGRYFVIYILEIVAAFFACYFLYKILQIKGCRFPIALVGISAIITYGSGAFVYGGSCVEEWALPFYMYLYYLMVLHIYKNKDITTKNLLIIGITGGFLFFSKYTLVSVYIGWFIYYLIHDKLTAIKTIPKIIAGVAISTIPIFCYFFVNNALQNFIDVYFVLNLSYKDDFSLELIMYNLVVLSRACLFPFVLLIYGFTNKKNKEKLFAFIELIFICIINFGLNSTRAYYFFVLFALLPMTVMSLEVIIGIMQNIRLQYIIIAALCLLTVCLACFTSPNIYKIGRKNTDTYIEEAYAYMNRNGKNANIVALNIDVSPYFAYTDTFPNEKYFCKININTYEYTQFFLEQIFNKTADYVIDVNDLKISQVLMQYGYTLEQQYPYHDADGDKWFYIFAKVG